MPNIDPFHLATVFIEMFNDKARIGSATGFFYSEDDKLYLITNKHVIYGDKFQQVDSKPICNMFNLLLHINANDLRQNEELKLKLSDGGKPAWFESPDTRIDIVVIPLEIDRKKYVIFPVDKSLLDCRGLLINFEKIFVMGYPFGWFDRINNLPITRIGHLSSPFMIPFNGNPIMLGDVETHKGMSGGPVFMELHSYMTSIDGKRSTHLGASKRILIGIHSGQPLWIIDDKTKEIKEEVKHSLINIWFSSLIPEIIASHKPNNSLGQS